MHSWSCVAHNVARYIFYSIVPAFVFAGIRIFEFPDLRADAFGQIMFGLYYIVLFSVVSLAPLLYFLCYGLKNRKNRFSGWMFLLLLILTNFMIPVVDSDYGYDLRTGNLTEVDWCWLIYFGLLFLDLLCNAIHDSLPLTPTRPN